MLEFHRYKKIAVLIAAILFLSFPFLGGIDGGGGYLGSDVPQSSSFDTNKIWSRGPTGNAVENASRHFKKHGHEFGFKTEAEYVAAAVQFTTEPLPDGVLKNTQKDGDTAYYNPKTAEYAVKSKKGFIRTYFKLNPKIHGFQSNTDYFNAQAGVGIPPAVNDNSRN